MKGQITLLTAILFLSGPIMAACAQQTTGSRPAAPTQRQKLKEYVEALQQSPGDFELREKIVKLGAALKPPPVIPEEARRYYLKAAAIQKTAKTPEDAALAISNYQQVLLLAPWWADAYYNMSSALELAGRYSEAISALKLYLASTPKDARAAQDHIYALEGEQEQAAAEDQKRSEQEAREQASQQELQRQREREQAAARQQADAARQQRAMLQSLNGEWRDATVSSECCPYDVRVNGLQFEMTQSRMWINGQWQSLNMAGADDYKGEINGLTISGTWSKNYGAMFSNGSFYSRPLTGTISPDGSRIHLEYDYVRPNGAVGNVANGFGVDHMSRDLIRSSVQF